MDQEYFESLYPDGARQAEIQEILGFVKEGKSCQLISVPGVGRSTLLGLLAYNKNTRLKHLGENQKQTHFVFVNFSEIRKRPLFDAMKFLFLSLADSLRERELEDDYLIVNEIFKERLGFGDELVLFQGLKEAMDYLALERKMTIVFLFDRFEEYVPTVTAEFFTNLRTLRKRAKYRFSVVFSLNRPLEAMLEPQLLADFYEFVAGNLVAVQLYDEQATRFRIAYIENITGKKLAKKELAGLIQLTGGHGKLTKLAVELLFSNESKKKDLAAFLLSQKIIRAALLEIWNYLTPAEQTSLLNGTFEDKELAFYLENVGLIQNNHIKIPLLEQFIKQEVKEPQIEKEHIVYDQHTNAIIKGAVTLSDQLTSSEFRLLRYMLQNGDRVVERDELINVVWQGMKSTAGITDQAVDQLVFRVRRKIEADPNTPAHLQTVKGRGFRLIA